jgi:hypothetical protein
MGTKLFVFALKHFLATLGVTSIKKLCDEFSQFTLANLYTKLDAQENKLNRAAYEV